MNNDTQKDNLSPNKSSVRTYGVNMYKFFNKNTGQTCVYFDAHKEDRSADKFFKQVLQGISAGRAWKVHKLFQEWGTENIECVRVNISDRDLSERQAHEAKKVAINLSIVNQQSILNAKHTQMLAEVA